MENFQQSRRAFLGALGAIGLLAALGRFLLPRRPVSRAILTIPRADLPADGALVYREARVAIMRQGEAVTAMSLICTHLGCTVTVTSTELVCPCHGSRFSRDGAVLAGPAERPLTRLAVRQQGDRLEIMATEGHGHG